MIRKEIVEIQGKFKECDKRVHKLFDDLIDNTELATEQDIVSKVLLLDINQYDMLVNYINKDLNEDEIKIIMDLNDIYNKFLNYLEMHNEKIMYKFGDKLSKNTVNYITNQKKKEREHNNTIINIIIDEGGESIQKEKITLKKLGINKNKDDENEK